MKLDAESTAEDELLICSAAYEECYDVGLDDEEEFELKRTLELDRPRNA